MLYDAATKKLVEKSRRKKFLRLEGDHYVIACQQYVRADENGYTFELDTDIKDGKIVLNTQNILLVGFNVEDESNGKYKISEKTRAEILRHCLVSFKYG